MRRHEVRLTLKLKTRQTLSSSLRMILKRVIGIRKFGRFLSSKVRNIGIIAHVDAGKTTTTENILFACGVTKEVGRVDDGNTVMDFLPQERERGITISSAAIAVSWKDHSINIIDTPGHVDFTVEVERSVRVLDSAVVVVDAVAGVQAQTRTVWKLAQKNSLPAIVFTNKMDRDGASLPRTISSLREKLGINGVPVQYPLFNSDQFTGLVDLTTMNMISWPPVNSKTPLPPTIESVTPSHPSYSDILIARNHLLESIADHDEDFMAQYLEDSEQFTPPTIRSTLRKICINRKIVPVLCGSSLKGKGIEPLLDSILEYLPSPSDVPFDQVINRETNDPIKVPPNSTDLYALAFKVIFDRARGPLLFVRVYSGVLNAKKALFNTTKQVKEMPNQVLSISADHLNPSGLIEAGNIGCIVGMKGTSTGDTLISNQFTSNEMKLHVMSGLTIPPNVYSISIETEKASEQPDLIKALEILTLEDPSLRYDVNADTGQTILSGLGELHLDIVCDKLRRQFQMDVHVGQTYVAYRETLDRNSLGSLPISTEYIFDRIIGTGRLFAGMTIKLDLIDTALPSQIKIAKDLPPSTKLTAHEMDIILDAFESCFSAGSKGYPIYGLSFTVTSITKDSDTTDGALRACIVSYISQLLKESQFVILEPIMLLEMESPDEYIGDILSDLSVKRRAEIKEILSLPGGISSVNATVPLATMLGYATHLRSITHGQGNFTIEYHSHQVVDQYNQP